MKSIDRFMPVLMLKYAISPQDILVSTINRMRLELGAGDRHETRIGLIDSGTLQIRLWTND